MPTLKLTLKPNVDLRTDPRNGLDDLAAHLADHPELVVIVAFCTVGQKTTKYVDGVLNPKSDKLPEQPLLLHLTSEQNVGLNIVAVESLWGEEAQAAGELLESAYSGRTGQERLPGAFRKALLHVHRFHPRHRHMEEEGDSVLSATPTDFIAFVQKRTRAE